MPSITNILLNTPLWVFGLLAALTWLGVQALQARTLPIWRVLATPAIFIAWGIASLVERSLSSPILLADWLIAVTLAAGIAAAMSRLDNIRIDRVTTRFVARKRIPDNPKSADFRGKIWIGCRSRACARVSVRAFSR
jgi:hypothetical protein